MDQFLMNESLYSTCLAWVQTFLGQANWIPSLSDFHADDVPLVICDNHKKGVSYLYYDLVCSLLSVNTYTA